MYAEIVVPESVRVYWRTFSPFTEYDPQTQQGAREEARRSSGGSRLMHAAAKFFREGVPVGRSASIRLAVQLGTSWLYVDANGRAQFGGKRGAFDTLAWERFLRTSPSAGLAPSELVRVTVDNRSKQSVTLTDAGGFVRAVVSPRQTKTVTTTFVEHQVRVGSLKAGKIHHDFLSVKGDPTSGSLKLLLKRRGDTIDGTWKPDKDNVCQARLVIE